MSRGSSLKRSEVGDAMATQANSGALPWGQPSHVIQQLWFSVIRHSWRSLAIVPVVPGGAGLQVAHALSEVGGIHQHSPLVLFDGLQLELRQVARMLEDISTEVKANERLLVALDSPLVNLCGVARAADKVLLVGELGKANLHSARKVMELIDPERFLGAVVLEEGLS